MLPRICLLHANRPDAAYVYVNIRNLSCFILCLCCE